MTISRANIPRELKGGRKVAAKNWIQKAIKKPGALRKSLGVPPGKNIPKGKLKAAAKKSGKQGDRARLALTLGKMRKKKKRKKT